jgi:tetratricopeptide (TPR) repeat protein
VKKVSRVNLPNLILLLVALFSFCFWIWEREFAHKQEPIAKPIVVLKTQVAAPLETPKEPFSSQEMVVYQHILVSYSTGNFLGAQNQVQQALLVAGYSDNFRSWLTHQLPVLMTSVGWMKIRTQDCDEAVKIFYKVLALMPVPEAQKGLGYCLRIAKSWPEAAGYLASYIMAKSSDVEGRLIYADTLESLGRFDDAVTILEGAVVLDGLDASVKTMANERLASMRAKSKSSARQKTERSDHFFVTYREDDHEAILQDVLDILENGVEEYSELLGMAPPNLPIEVILYRKEDFIEVFAGGPAWAEGLFDGRLRVPVSSDMLRDVKGRLETVLRHELAHAMLSFRSGGRAWPTWFDEGLAQYLSCRKRPCGRFEFPATPGIMSTKEVLTQPFIVLDSIEAGRAYLHSLYFVRALVRAKGEPILDFISNKVPAAGALTSDFIAESSGWDSYAGMYSDVFLWWGKREAL